MYLYWISDWFIDASLHSYHDIIANGIRKLLGYIKSIQLRMGLLDADPFRNCMVSIL